MKRTPTDKVPAASSPRGRLRATENENFAYAATQKALTAAKRLLLPYNVVHYRKSNLPENDNMTQNKPNICPNCGELISGNNIHSLSTAQDYAKEQFENWKAFHEKQDSLKGEQNAKT